MSKNKENVFSAPGCLSLDTIIRYLNDELPVKESHRVEKHMLDCELCKEAVEGYALMEKKDRAAGIIFELNKRLAGNTDKIFYIRRIAAGIAAVFVLAGGLFYLNLHLINTDATMAIKTKKSEIDSVKHRIPSAIE